MAYALAAGAAGAAALVVWGGQDAAISRQLSLTDQEADRSSRALTQARTRLAATQAVLTTARQIVGQPDWSSLLALLAAKGNGQIVLKGCLLRPATAAAADGTPAGHGYVLIVEGMGRSPADAQQYVLRLENARLFDRVTLLDTRNEPFLDIGVSAFRVECQLGSSPVLEAAPSGKDKQ